MDTSNEADTAVEEKELIQFDQVDEFRRILLSDDFYPGGLGNQVEVKAPLDAAQAVDRQAQAREEKSLQKLTRIVSRTSLAADSLLSVFVSFISVPPCSWTSTRNNRTFWTPTWSQL
jgi:hypothetical protein